MVRHVLSEITDNALPFQTNPRIPDLLYVLPFLQIRRLKRESIEGLGLGFRGHGQ